MAQPEATKKSKEKKLVFEKVKSDPLSNPEAFNVSNMAQPEATKKSKEKKLVFEKVKSDPLSNPEAFNVSNVKPSKPISPVNVDSGWDSNDEQKKSKMEEKEEIKDNYDYDDMNFEKIEKNIERAKKK
eukprot:764214_1